MNPLERLSRQRSYDGWVEFYAHPSESCRTKMRFSIYLPPQAATTKVPVLYWLSGLSCTEENFMAKAGAEAHAARHGIAVVAPDTSPRGAGIEGEDKDWDLGTGAGFYVNATQAPWSTYYRMYDYVTQELPALVNANFPVLPERQGIFGHSMGGHGALVISLREGRRYRSVSAFAPISAPSRCPWGNKAFSTYLGCDSKAWAEYDASELLSRGKSVHSILVDQGADDKFLKEQLMPWTLKEAAEHSGSELILRMREGYDHSYYFIRTFLKEHFEHHARWLAE